MSNPELGSREEPEEINPVVEQISEPTQPDKPEEKKEGMLRRFIGATVQATVNESRLPSQEYKSEVGVYGGKIKIEEDGKMVLDRRGLVSNIDRVGDAVLRAYDEHVVKEPKKLLKMHPKIAAEKFFYPGTKRYRGTNEEVLENAERLGLGDFYGPHEHGIEIKKPEVFEHGVHLMDIYRSDIIGAEKLEEVDRFQALAEAAKYTRKLHDEHGAVGELNTFHFLFQKDQDGKVSDPVIYIPDIVWNKKKNISEADKKTTDMLDFLSSTFVEELRRSGKVEDTGKALDTILENYGDKKIISLVESFIKRGRLTLQGDTELLNLPDSITKKARGIFSQHNKARIGAKNASDAVMKKEIMEACERFINKQKND